MCFKTHLSNDDKPKAHALKKKEDGWTKKMLPKWLFTH